jgi:hypothetical protein
LTKRNFNDDSGSAADFFSGLGMGDWGTEMNGVSDSMKPTTNNIFYNGVELFSRGIYGLSEHDIKRVNDAVLLNEGSDKKVCFISFTGWENEHLVKPHDCFYVENVEILKAMINSFQGTFDLFIVLPVTAMMNGVDPLYKSVMDFSEWFKSESSITSSVVLLDNQCIEADKMESCASLLTRACDRRLK